MTTTDDETKDLDCWTCVDLTGADGDAPGVDVATPGAGADGYTVVYDVTIIRDVGSSAPVTGFEVDTAGELLETMHAALDVMTGAGLELLFDGCKLGAAAPGWVKPGSFPEVDTGTWLAPEEVREASDVELSSMGEYVNLGICRLVALAVLFLTTSTLLDAASEAAAEEVGMGLFWADVRPGSDVDVGVVVEDSFVVGFGGGVMNDVEKTVCGFCVTSGEPSGLTKVMAGAIDVNIVS